MREDCDMEGEVHPAATRKPGAVKKKHDVQRKLKEKNMAILKQKRLIEEMQKKLERRKRKHSKPVEVKAKEQDENKEIAVKKQRENQAEVELELDKGGVGETSDLEGKKTDTVKHAVQANFRVKQRKEINGDSNDMKFQNCLTHNSKILAIAAYADPVVEGREYVAVCVQGGVNIWQRPRKGGMWKFLNIFSPGHTDECCTCTFSPCGNFILVFGNFESTNMVQVAVKGNEENYIHCQNLPVDSSTFDSNPFTFSCYIRTRNGYAIALSADEGLAGDPNSNKEPTHFVTSPLSPKMIGTYRRILKNLSIGTVTSLITTGEEHIIASTASHICVLTMDLNAILFLCETNLLWSPDYSNNVVNVKVHDVKSKCISDSQRDIFDVNSKKIDSKEPIDKTKNQLLLVLLSGCLRDKNRLYFVSALCVKSRKVSTIGVCTLPTFPETSTSVATKATPATLGPQAHFSESDIEIISEAGLLKYNLSSLRQERFSPQALLAMKDASCFYSGRNHTSLISGDVFIGSIDGCVHVFSQ